MSINELPLEIKATVAELCKLSDFISLSMVNDEWYQACQLTNRHVTSICLSDSEYDSTLKLFDYNVYDAVNNIHINYSIPCLYDNVRGSGNCGGRFNGRARGRPTHSSTCHRSRPIRFNTCHTVKRRLGMVKDVIEPVNEYNIITKHGFRVEVFKEFFKLLFLIQFEYLSFDANILLNIPDDILAGYTLCRFKILHSSFCNLTQNQAFLLSTIFESREYKFTTNFNDETTLLEIPMTANVLCADTIKCYSGFCPNADVLDKLNVQEAIISKIKMSFDDVYRWILGTLSNSPTCKRQLQFFEADISGSLVAFVDSLKNLNFEFTKFELGKLLLQTEEGWFIHGKEDEKFDLEYTIHGKKATWIIKKQNAEYYLDYRWTSVTEM